MLRKANSIFDAIIDALLWLAGIILFLGVLSVCTEVFMRYFLNRPQIWVVEITENMLLFITFLATTWLLRREAHVKIDVVLTLLSQRKQALVCAVTSIICTIPLLLLVWYGGQVVWDHFQRGTYLPTNLRLPTAPLLSIIVVGSFILFIQFLRRARGYWVRWRSLPTNE